MALAYVSSTISSATAVATAVPVAYPASIAIGDLLVLLVGTKPFNAVISPPSFWRPLGEITNGTNITTADTGSVKMAAFVLEAGAALSGSLTVDIATANSSWASIVRVTKAANTYYDAALATGTDTTAGTTWSVAFGSNPGITSGDLLILGGVWSTDAANTVSASAFSATSATFSALVGAGDQNPLITTNNDLGGNTNHFSCTAGTASANGTWTATHTNATNNSGSAVLVRLRESGSGALPGLVMGRFG